ncbi:MAG TPA: FAD-dependent oxidoreductase [Pyrinomonadaceae bacterium]|jgi:phytoene dehydrogenase-like protein
MECEVVVVGAGIGGLTVAALLAQRGVNVCVLERERQVGGCAAAFEKFGYTFEPGYGLFSGWKPDEIHHQIFAELPVDPPEVRACETPYVVRLPDASEIALTSNQEEFQANLRRVFPECWEKAVDFYARLEATANALRRADAPSFPLTSTADYLAGASLRFRRFIDVQLQTFAQAGSAEVSYGRAALALSASRAGMWTIRGGAPALADRLAQSIKQSGGRIRLNTPVLRLAYDSTGSALGVDLLSGETVIASKAIVSNLTLWDTYGKLVGLNRTPGEIRTLLKTLRGWGAYLIYVSLDQPIGASLPPDRVLSLSDWQEDQLNQSYAPENNQLFFAAAPAWDARAPDGKRAATVHAFTGVDEWFNYHTDETQLEQQDQHLLEECWQRLHAAIPELGGSAEVIETVTPRGYYETTRRKLGMVGGVIPSLAADTLTPAWQTALPNLFIVSDTASAGNIEALSQAAWALAERLTR